MQSLIKKIFAVILITLILSCSLTPALAANPPLSDINAKTTRIESLTKPDLLSDLGYGQKYGFGATQGLSVASSGDKKRLFVVRFEDDLPTKAVLYMYKNYENISEGYEAFLLDDLVAHANGMAIDSKYIYIACWDNDKSDVSDEHKIVRIKRQTLWELYNDPDINKRILTANSQGVTVMQAVYDSNGNEFDKKIVGITYYKNGEFIIGTPRTKLNGEWVLNFTTATVSDNGTADEKDDKLIVSNDAADKFQVAFDDISTTAGQDIGYDPNCGFFIVRSYKTKNSEDQEVATTNNAIIWIRLDSKTGNNRVYRIDDDESLYRIIRVNKSSNIFEKYELESVSIGVDNNMYASVNVKVWGKETDEEYKQYNKYRKDPIIQIMRPDGNNFLGTNIEA